MVVGGWTQRVVGLLSTLFTGRSPCLSHQNHGDFGETRILVRVPKNTLSCGVEIFRLTTENHHDFLVGPKSLWCKKWRRQRSDTKQPHSDTKTTDTKTRRQPQQHATTTSFLSWWQQSFVAIGIFGQQARQRVVNNEP